jgi:hypothetical protein
MKIFILAGLLLGTTAGASATEYRIRTVDFPGAANTALYAINDDAHCVGAEKDRSGAHHAIVFAEGALQTLDPNGLVGRSPQSWAFSINNRGDIAGAIVDSAGSYHGFVHHRDHSVETIDYPGGFDSQAFGINDHDTVIGVYNDAVGGSHAFVRRAGVYSTIDLAGGLQTIPFSINDREEIVGEYITTLNTNGYGYIQKASGSYSIFTAPGSDPQQTFFISINNRDQILGGYANATVAQQNFLVTRSVYALFDLPPSIGANGVSAQTVNDSDEIVGYYFDSAGVAHGFLAIPAKDEEED